MNLPEWMPPQPELPWVEGSLDGDLPPSAVRQWAHEYALAAVEAYKASRKPVAWITAPHGVLRYDPDFRLTGPQTLDWKLPLYRLDEE
jgi:hypothetical protein